MHPKSSERDELYREEGGIIIVKSAEDTQTRVIGGRFLVSIFCDHFKVSCVSPDKPAEGIISVQFWGNIIKLPERMAVYFTFPVWIIRAKMNIWSMMKHKLDVCLKIRDKSCPQNRNYEKRKTRRIDIGCIRCAKRVATKLSQQFYRICFHIWNPRGYQEHFQSVPIMFSYASSGEKNELERKRKRQRQSQTDIKIGSIVVYYLLANFKYENISRTALL